MKISEKQLIIMLRVLEGSLMVHDRSDIDIFGYDIEIRRNTFKQIIEQQPDEPKDLGLLYINESDRLRYALKRMREIG